MSACLGLRSGVVRFVTVTSAVLLGAALARPAAAADCAGLAGALIGQAAWGIAWVGLGRTCLAGRTTRADRWI